MLHAFLLLGAAAGTITVGVCLVIYLTWLAMTEHGRAVKRQRAQARAAYMRAWTDEAFPVVTEWDGQRFTVAGEAALSEAAQSQAAQSQAVQPQPAQSEPAQSGPAQPVRGQAWAPEQRHRTHGFERRR
jgi:hypothetical protein